MSVATNPPFNGRLFNDAFYVTSGSITTAPTSVDFTNTYPYPTTEKFDVQVSTTLFQASGNPGATASVYIQDSPDNTTFTNIAAFAAPVLTQKGSGSNSILLKLEPSGSRYLRVSGSTNSANYTGSFVGLSVQF